MSDISPALNPPSRILMGPGPSDIHPRVLQAIGKPTVGHLDPYYLDLMDHLQQMLRRLFVTENPMTFAVSATMTTFLYPVVRNTALRLRERRNRLQAADAEQLESIAAPPSQPTATGRTCGRPPARTDTPSTSSKARG